MDELSCRLLVVEDNPTDEMLLRRAIREEGLRVDVVVVKDGDEAIRYLEDCSSENVPHLVVIDINLPKRSGIDVLRKCRFTPLLVQTKTLIFTSSDAEGDHRRSELLGVDAYMRKPASLDDFPAVAKTIRKLLYPNMAGAA
jgi:CheY-like chemotaxis protein